MLCMRRYEMLCTDGAGIVKFDLVSCLNLLDRCSRPLDLLRQIRSSLVPITGRALIAVVYPFIGYVEDSKYNFLHKILFIIYSALVASAKNFSVT